MPEYFFVLGRDPALAAAELSSYFSSRNIKHNIKSVGPNLALVDAHIDLAKTVVELGGTVKAGSILTKTAGKRVGALDSSELWTGRGNKLNWTVSALDNDKVLEEELKSYLKQRFKTERLKAMWKSEPRPSEQVAWKAGIEIVSFTYNRETYFGRTVAVSDLRAVQRRDLGRPAQRPEIAVSVRLAKMLINLTGVRPGQRLLDPFCGIGTVLQEALLTGVEASGIDIDPANIAASKRNLEWFTDKYAVRTSWSLDVGNATELPEQFERDSIDAIATEPYLGPLLKSVPSEAQVRKIMSELTLLYRDFLAAAHAVLKTNSRMAVVFPRFVTNRGAVEVPIKQMAEKIGFEIWQPETFPYLYTGERKKLDRLIYVLVKH